MKNRTFTIDLVTTQINHEKQLKDGYRIGKNSKELYELGEKCFFNPELMQGLDDETLNSKPFLNGYQRGKRLALIEEMEEGNKKAR